MWRFLFKLKAHYDRILADLGISNQCELKLEAQCNSYRSQLPENAAKSVLVRQALSHAVNKDEIVNVGLGGLGQAAFAPLPPGIPGYDDSLKEHELGYDPEKARQLLRDAGYPNGISIKGILPNTGVKRGAILKKMFNESGINVTFQALPMKYFLKKWQLNITS